MITVVLLGGVLAVAVYGLVVYARVKAFIPRVGQSDDDEQAER